jgi:hypothetical protein
MNRKIKNTLGLLALLLIVLVAGGVYLLVFQKGKIEEKSAKLSELKINDYNTDQLTYQYQDLVLRAAVLDSVLAARKFNIPQNTSSIKFFNFINQVSTRFSANSQVSVEYMDQKEDKEFLYHEYRLAGSADYNDLYGLIYAVEQSKELKKISSVNLSNVISTDKEGMPHFLVGYTLITRVYFSPNDRFATGSLIENQLVSRRIYDAFYPLIRNEIPPNIDFLLDVNGARLLALIPEGAFISDSRGNTYLLWEGDPVYLGYVTKIDYKNNKINFILNKGGIIERVELDLEKEGIQSKLN